MVIAKSQRKIAKGKLQRRLSKRESLLVDIPKSTSVVVMAFDRQVTPSKMTRNRTMLGRDKNLIRPDTPQMQMIDEKKIGNECSTLHNDLSFPPLSDQKPPGQNCKNS